LSEGALLQGSLTQGSSRDSRLAHARDWEGLLEMQKGQLKPGTDAQKETHLGRMSLEDDGLGTDDSLHSQGHVLRECDPQGPGKGHMIHAGNNLSFSTPSSTRGRRHTSVWSVGRPSNAGHTSCSTSGFTLERSPLSAVNGERPSPTAPAPLLSFIRGSTLEEEKQKPKPFQCEEFLLALQTHE